MSLSQTFYRVFLGALTVFFLTMPAQAKPNLDDAYIVKGITVDVTGSSALDARNKAFVEARRKAYESMIAKVAAPGADIAIPDDRAIAAAIKDFSIKNEKMTSRRYAGTMDVRFTPAAVKKAMAMAGTAQPASPDVATATAPSTRATTTTVTDEAGVTTTTTVAMPRKQQGGNAAPVAAVRTAPATLVLPWFGNTGRQTLWAQGNPWRAAWEANDKLARDRNMPFVLPVGDVDDVRDYSPPQPLSRRGNLEALLRRYNAQSAVVALAEPAPDGGVLVSLYHLDADMPKPMGRFGVSGQSRDPMGDAVAQAAMAMRAMAPGGQAEAVQPVSMDTQARVPLARAEPPQAVSPMGSYRMLARFANLQQWVAMRQALTRVPGMGAIDIRAISPSQANIEFSYSGGPQTLASAMQQSGLQLTQLPPGSVGAIVPGAQPPQFMLSMGRSY